MKFKFSILLILSVLAARVYGQLTPQQAAAAMVRGINIGNTMDAPDGETTWGNIAVQQRAFADYKNAGFTAVRIPITWDKRLATTSPYAVTTTWMNRVEQVVDWGLKQKLIIIINAHHEDWIKKNYTAENIARFDSLWSQIATRFMNKSDSLIFEIINEPNPLAKLYVDELNKRVLQIIRRTNPHRIVAFSGDKWSGAFDLMNAGIPDVNDSYLMGYYHSYDPYPFGLEGTGTYGTDADLNTTKKQFDTIAYWISTKNIPVFLGEYGAQVKCDYNSRMACYASVVYQSLAHNIPCFAWDDNGYFPMYNRILGTFNEIKDIAIYTQLESPYKFFLSDAGVRKIRLTWVNRTLTDSITIERSANGATGFLPIAKLAPEAQQYIDSTVISGNTYYYRLRTTVPGKIVMSYPIRTTLVCDPVAITPYYKIGANGLMQQSGSANLKVGDSIKLSPEASSGSGTWSWKGPNSFTSSSREITISNISLTSAGKYTATYTVMNGCPNSYTFEVTVCQTIPIVPYLQIAGASQIQDSIAIVKAGSGVKFSPQAATGGTWSWIGPNGYKSTSSSLIITGIQESKTGIYQVSYTVSPVCVSKCNYVIKLFTTGISTIERNKIKIYPNPSKGIIKIEGLKGELIQLFNTSGTKVFETIQNDNNQIDTKLTTGIYIIKISYKDSVVYERLVVD